MDQAYSARAWMKEHVRDVGHKGWFCKRMGFSRPTGNTYLQASGAPWPLPSPEHLIFVVDGETHTIRWVTQSALDGLQLERSNLVGRRFPHVLRAQRGPMPDIVQRAEEMKNQPDGILEYDTEYQRADGFWLPLHVRCTYGRLYDVWFIDAEQIGDAVPPAAVEAVIRKAEDSLHDSTREVNQERVGVALSLTTWTPPPMAHIVVHNPQSRPVPQHVIDQMWSELP